MVTQSEELKRLSEVIRGIAEPIVQEAGLMIYDLTCRRNKRNVIIRLTLDRMEGELTVAHCEGVSRQLSAALDIEEPIQNRYFLEVSTPGVERSLRSLEECCRFIGRLAIFSFEDGSTVIGKITGVEGRKVLVTPEDGEPVELNFGEWRDAHLKLDLASALKKKEK